MDHLGPRFHILMQMQVLAAYTLPLVIPLMLQPPLVPFPRKESCTSAYRRSSTIKGTSLGTPLLQHYPYQQIPYATQTTV
ncbi:hypothetical protein SLE2022_314340 [Rubroshorea leprosula]